MKLFDIKICRCEISHDSFFLVDWLGAFYDSPYTFSSVSRSKSLNFICKRNNEMKKGVLHKGKILMKFIFERD